MPRLVTALLIALSASLPVVGTAQEASPPTTLPVTPLECNVASYDLTTVLAPGVVALPDAAATEPARRPRGEPADAATVAAVTEVIVEHVGCTNLGYRARLAYLFAPEALRHELADSDGELTAEAIQEFSDLAMAEEPSAPEEQATIVAIKDVEVLADGRVGAVVVSEMSGGSVSGAYFVFRAVDGRYLLDASPAAAGPAEVGMMELEGSAMRPTIDNGQVITVVPPPEVEQPPARGDIVVLVPPIEERVYYVKRVIGLPGETIAFRDGDVYIDGVQLEEPYIEGGITECERAPYCELTVPEEHVYVLGDNRPNSTDSRVFGPVQFANIVGIVVL